MTPSVQQDPAEGSREIVERELKRAARASRPPKAAREDVLRLLGETSPDRIAAIPALEPAIADLELAAQWGQGNVDVAGQAGHPLTGKAAIIVDIIRPDWEEPEEEP